VIEYEVRPEHRDQAQARLKATGGPPPEGTKMIARYHKAGGLGGYVIAETDSAEAMCRWTQAWSDLLTFTVTPVVDDETIAKVIG
jgi:hypothetical protein